MEAASDTPSDPRDTAMLTPSPPGLLNVKVATVSPHPFSVPDDPAGWVVVKPPSDEVGSRALALSPSLIDGIDGLRATLGSCSLASDVCSSSGSTSTKRDNKLMAAMNQSFNVKAGALSFRTLHEFASLEIAQQDLTLVRQLGEGQ